ncbi:uncharacterized protein LOC117606789 isoform X3 [Osmia lignaria lignaria]|uniref:uncharacterized protein LOC117606789 isoform X3 n=1 Tax=Osmia lignaria lignaria TaxID=1437193 RepID=UPI0014789A85|nr:uncharacterized protein LOC117606789 isoform X1 [Osmia lignaria]
MDNVDGGESLDNLEYDTNLVSRAENLRRVLGELRNALRIERLNLHQEIEMTILQKFIERGNYRSLSDGTRRNFLMANVARNPMKFSKFHDPTRVNNLAYLGSSMYQKIIDELQDELNLLEQRLSAATSCSYKRKIYDLEAICSADLNRLKSRFVRSLQPFGNTIHWIGQLSPRRIKPTSCRCTTKKPPMEGASLRNTSYVRSLAILRSKSADTSSDHQSWKNHIYLQRYSDSEMYRNVYKPAVSLENSQILYSSDSESNWKMSKSITTIFPKVSRVMS